MARYQIPSILRSSIAIAGRYDEGENMDILDRRMEERAWEHTTII